MVPHELYLTDTSVGTIISLEKRLPIGSYDLSHAVFDPVRQMLVDAFEVRGWLLEDGGFREGLQYGVQLGHYSGHFVLTLVVQEQTPN